MVGLTQRQQMVLDFIIAFRAEHGYPPTLREIGAHMGIRSTNGVNDHLNALERKGRIRHADTVSRGIVVLDESGVPLPPPVITAAAPMPERAPSLPCHQASGHGPARSRRRRPSAADLVQMRADVEALKSRFDSTCATLTAPAAPKPVPSDSPGVPDAAVDELLVRLAQLEAELAAANARLAARGPHSTAANEDTRPTLEQAADHVDALLRLPLPVTTMALVRALQRTMAPGTST